MNWNDVTNKLVEIESLQQLLTIKISDSKSKEIIARYNKYHDITKDSINKLNNMIQNGDISKIMANIPPDMLDNFSKMMNNNSNSSTDSNNTGNFNNSKTSNNFNNFDFNNIDMNTIMKMKNIMEKLNNSNDPRSNLLASLKPYLRENRKEKLDQYANLMNFAKIAEVLKSENISPNRETNDSNFVNNNNTYYPSDNRNSNHPEN